MKARAAAKARDKVVHPLFDKGEKKRDPEKVGPMKMTPAVRFSLIALRLYLVLLLGLGGYRVIEMALSAHK
jgi:hypothetical protein